MDRTALAEKRRETVIGLLKSMTIKKDTDTGFNKDDVHECIQQLCNLYETHIEELENGYESEIAKMVAKYQKYEENNDLYVSLIMDAKKTGNEIVTQAQSEVDSILARGQEKIAAKEEEYNSLDAKYKEKVDELEKELSAVKDRVASESASLSLALEEEKEIFNAKRDRYRQHIDAMETEFEEIKTNILRTSARLDGLKSQVENVVEDVQWKIDRSRSVEIPESDAGVEEIDIPEEIPVAPTEMFVADEIATSEVVDPVEIIDTIESIDTVDSSDSVETIPTMETPEEAPIAPVMPETEAVTEDSPQVEIPEARATEEVVADTQEISLADMLEEAPAFAELAAEEPTDFESVEAAPVAEGDSSVEDLLSEISFDDVLADVPEMTESADAPEVEISLDNLNETEAAEADIEEISFEKLEEMFKDEK